MTRGSISANDAWQKILEKYDIVNKVSKDGIFHIKASEIKEFKEVGLCGTAAVISPIGKINDHGTDIEIPSGMGEIGPVLKELRQTLVDIQECRIEGPEGWVVEVK